MNNSVRFITKLLSTTAIAVVLGSLLASCNGDDDDNTANGPKLSVVIAVPAYGSDTTPNFVFSSSEAGSIIYGGDCTSAATSAVAGNNTITFNPLAEGEHSNCTIHVKNANNHLSQALQVNTFTIQPFYWVTSIQPSEVLMPGVETKLSGFNLEAVTVTIDGVAVTPTEQNPHEFRFIAPTLPKGKYVMEISGSKGSNSRTVKFNTCVAQPDGSIWCLGDDGKDFFAGSTEPVTVSGISTAVDVTFGLRFSCALLAGGSVKCWGENKYGTLGDGTTVNSSSPVAVIGINSAVQISSSLIHTCALLEDGAVQCWGNNDSGQLGDASETNSPLPVTVVGIANAVSISVGSSHSCALLADGSIKCWGNNRYGELGNGTLIDSNVPVLVSGISTATELGGASCALLANTTVECWGYAGYISRGYAAYEESFNSTPAPLEGVTGAVAISKSGLYGCVLLNNGTIRCWGANYYGQLGDGTSMHKTVPVVVKGISTAVSVEVGESHSCARLQDGSVQCWGSNRYGKLGDGTLEDSPLPKPVGYPWEEAAGMKLGDGTCVVLKDGYVQCWGYLPESEVSPPTVVIQP